jgi:hypothetical protein
LVNDAGRNLDKMFAPIENKEHALLREKTGERRHEVSFRRFSKIQKQGQLLGEEDRVTDVAKVRITEAIWKCPGNSPCQLKGEACFSRTAGAGDGAHSRFSQ